MNEIITEKSYPIQNSWLFKQVFIMLLALPIFFFALFDFIFGNSKYLLVIIILLFISILMSGFVAIVNALRRSCFHYSLDESFMVINQGVISKKNRNIPYGVIQGIFVSRGLFERIFGLASLTFEDFSQGGKSDMDSDGFINDSRTRLEILGFEGNKIHIPGLKKEDAEELKDIILQRIKENPIEDNQSGL